MSLISSYEEPKGAKLNEILNDDNTGLSNNRGTKSILSLLWEVFRPSILAQYCRIVITTNLLLLSFHIQACFLGQHLIIAKSKKQLYFSSNLQQQYYLILNQLIFIQTLVTLYIYFVYIQFIESMSIIEQSLSQLFINIQQIAFQKQSASINFPFITSLSKQTQQEIINTMDDSLGLTQNNLKLVSHINFNELIPKLNQIWSGEYFGRDLKIMFNRNYHAERRNFKQLSQKTKKQNFNELKKQVNWSNVKLQNGQVQTELQINGCDIETLKKGEVAPTIITNYIKLLHASKVINTNYFVFPFGFFDQIINTEENDIQKIRASVTQNHTKLREQIQVNLCKPQYLLVPILIDKGYRLIIVAHLSVQKKRKLILCNTSEEKAKNFVQALKLFLEIDMHVSNKKKKKQSLKSLSTISIMLPKQINPKDTGLYLMLYCQFLFAKKAIQLENLSTITQHQKIHLFPRSLALKSRVQIWNLFARLLEEQNPQMRVEICQQFFKRRLQFCQEAILQLNYDKIEEQQVRKYMAIKREGFDKLGLDYYLDSNLHYQNSIQS